jgi:[histone H3]-dimethyl-L-lysine9 demethylase
MVQSAVQLAFDFLAPESLPESVRIAEEIRCLPNGHTAKLKMVEVTMIPDKQ